jgi:hypothetical protein
MLEQERYLANLDAELASSDDRLHPLYQEIHTQDGTVLYFNKFAGYLGRIPYICTYCNNADRYLYCTAP